MKLRVVTALAFLATACTSTDEKPDASAEEAVVAESAELTEESKPADAAAPTAEQPTTDEAKKEEATTDAKPGEEAKSEEVAAAPVPSPETAPTSEAVAPVGALYVAVSHLNVRSGPGMAHPVVDVVTFNTPIQNLGIENRIWVKIGEGRYASNKYLVASQQSSPTPVEMSTPAVQPAAAEQNMPESESAPEQTEEEQAADPS